MPLKFDSDDCRNTFAKRFMTAFVALRSHVMSRSIVVVTHGLNASQIKTLHLIFHRPGISQTAVAERLGVTTASISTSVRELEAQGLIERRPDPKDARVMLLYLAPSGEEIFEEVFGTFINTFSDLLDVLPPEEQKQFIERFEALLAANQISLDNDKLNYADRLHTVKEVASPASDGGDSVHTFANEFLRAR